MFKPTIKRFLMPALAVAPVGGLAADSVYDKDWRFRVEAAGVHRGDASLGDGEKVSRDSLIVRVAVDRSWTESLSAGLAIGYEEDRYDFSGFLGLGPEAPWEDIRTLQLGLPLIYRGDDSWSLFVLPTLRYAAEKGADLSDGRELGVIAAASYRFSDRLTLGPGFGVFSEIEGGSDVFPILLVNWRITDTVSLETGRGLGASRGPGVSLRWRPAASWTFSLGARYEKRRFRLADDGPIPDGVGEDRTVPVAFGAEYAVARRARLNLLVGADFAGQLWLGDHKARKIADSDYDAASFVGGVLSYRF